MPAHNLLSLPICFFSNKNPNKRQKTKLKVSSFLHLFFWVKKMENGKNLGRILLCCVFLYFCSFFFWDKKVKIYINKRIKIHNGVRTNVRLCVIISLKFVHFFLSLSLYIRRIVDPYFDASMILDCTRNTRAIAIEPYWLCVHCRWFARYTLPFIAVRNVWTGHRDK